MKTLLKRSIVLLAVTLPIADAGADPWASTAGGGVVGGVIGGLVAGVPGAAVGVVLGGTMGHGADAEKQAEQQKAIRSADYFQQADWERERRKRNQQLADLRQENWGSNNYPQPTVKVASISADVAVPSSDMALVTDIQRSLIKLGYDPGEMGVLNRQTVAVIKLYQEQHDLIETGRPSPQLLRHLHQNGG